MTFVGILMTSLTYAQADKSKRASPPETATGTVDGSTITINYSSPAVKGRKIWGGLVPYDKVWRLGANEATIFEAKTSKWKGKNCLPENTAFMLFLVKMNGHSFSIQKPLIMESRFGESKMRKELLQKILPMMFCV